MYFKSLESFGLFDRITYIMSKSSDLASERLTWEDFTGIKATTPE